MTRPKKKIDIFLRVVESAFVTYEKPPASTARLLVKVWTPEGEDLIGLSFDDVNVIDSMLRAISRCRQEIEKKPAIDPRLKGPTDGSIH